MLKLDEIIKKYSSRLEYTDKLAEDESLKSLRSVFKSELIDKYCKVTYKKPILKITTHNASLKNELMIKKNTILAVMKKDLGKNAPTDIKLC
jgi:hypothetical protein